MSALCSAVTTARRLPDARSFWSSLGISRKEGRFVEEVISITEEVVIDCFSNGFAWETICKAFDNISSWRSEGPESVSRRKCSFEIFFRGLVNAVNYYSLGANQSPVHVKDYAFYRRDRAQSPIPQPTVLVDDLVFDSNSPLFLHSSEIECVVSVSHEESDYSVLCSLRTD